MAEEDEWEDDPQVAYVDLPELHRADAAVVLQEVQVNQWGSRDASLVLNGRFEMKLVPESAGGTHCLFQVNTPDNQVTLVDHVQDYYSAQIVCKAPKEPTTIVTFPLTDTK